MRPTWLSLSSDSTVRPLFPSTSLPQWPSPPPSTPPPPQSWALRGATQAGAPAKGPAGRACRPQRPAMGTEWPSADSVQAGGRWGGTVVNVSLATPRSSPGRPGGAGTVCRRSRWCGPSCWREPAAPGEQARREWGGASLTHRCRVHPPRAAGGAKGRKDRLPLQRSGWERGASGMLGNGAPVWPRLESTVHNGAVTETDRQPAPPLRPPGYGYTATRPGLRGAAGSLGLSRLGWRAGDQVPRIGGPGPIWGAWWGGGGRLTMLSVALSQGLRLRYFRCRS